MSLLPVLFTACTRTILSSEPDPGLEDDFAAPSGCSEDADADGHLATACTGGDDCDDAAVHVFPGAIEFRDGIDNDCDGVTDEENTLTAAPLTYAGETAGDAFGTHVSGADAAGDGYADLLITAPGRGDILEDAGAVYFQAYDALTPPAAGDFSAVSATGSAAYDQFGSAATVAVDLDGDGRRDLAVGIKGSDYNGSAAGSVAVYRGETDGTFADAAVVTLLGEAPFDGLGTLVAAAGDPDGDGWEDLLTGAYGHDGARGAAYIFWGAETFTGGDRVVDTAAMKIAGRETEEMFAWAGAGGGDVTGDGLDDVVIGAPGNAVAGAAAGAVYLVSGTPNDDGLAIDHAIYGDGAYDQFGYAVAIVPDADGDGRDDVLAGAPFVEGAAADSGRAYLFLRAITEAFAAGEADVLISGDAAGAMTGLHVGAVGDLNADGLGDFTVGGLADTGEGPAGAAWLFLGKDPFDPAELTGADADALFTAAPSDGTLYAWAAGDLDGAVGAAGGYPDLVLSLPGFEDRRGLAVIYKGQATGP